MTAAFTVILPHKRNPGNDRALAIALDCLLANTVNDFVLLMDAAYDAPLYERINNMIRHAPTDCVVYTASDTFLAPGWDLPMLAAWNADTIVTDILVEPGAIGLHHLNYHKDFGRKPETFDRAGFEAWTASADAPMLEGEGWFCPYAISRSAFLEMGGLQAEGLATDHHGFSGADELFFAKWKDAGKTVKRAQSYAYHLQRWSQEDEQTKEGR